MNTITNPLLWERMPGETDKAFKAFCTYRDLRQNRSFTVLLETLGKKSKTQFAIWSKKYNWQARLVHSTMTKKGKTGQSSRKAYRK